jgi:hypothetical protein
MSSQALLPQHEALIDGSAIASSVAEARGYRSVTNPADLLALGFADYQCRTPGLLIPLWDVTGQNSRYHFRPDAPRSNEAGKPIKYETPAGSRLALDVPRSVRPHLGDPTIPLWVTEGARKVDAAVSHGLCCIGVSGVWGWRGTNEHGGKAALPDWESIALNGREVFLAYDSDVMSKLSVRAALDRLASFLRGREARVRFVLLSEGVEGEKVGFDDYFVGGGTVEGLPALTVDALPLATVLPPYPTHVFPPPVRRFIIEAAAALDAPEEMIGLPLMAFAAAAIGNTRFVEIKRGFRQRPILWTAVVGKPGTAKSPGLDAASGPLRALQEHATAGWKQEMEQFERDLADWNALDKSGKSLVVKPTAPRLEHFLTTDSTKEALGVMATESAGLAVYRDELTAWVAGFDAYRSGRGGDRQDMLSLWSGTPLKIDRKNAPPIVVERPTVSVVGGVQPDRLSFLSAEAGQDGFLDRPLWAYPDVPVMYWTDAEVSEEAETAISNLFAKLRVSLGAAHPEGYRLQPCAQARALFVEWHDENAMLQEVASPLLRGVYAKLPLQLLRIALVLHCLAHPEPQADELSVETMEGAIALVEFHRTHAAKVMAHFQHLGTVGGGDLAARIIRILRIFERENADGWGSRSDLLHRLGNVKSHDLTAALNTLLAARTIERRAIATTTKDAEQWRLTRTAQEIPHSKYSTFSTEAPNSSNLSNTSNLLNGPDQPDDGFGNEMIL